MRREHGALSYLFAYFTGEENKGEQIYFSLSKDGLNWTDINDRKPVLIPNAGTKGARDPFIVKNEKSNKYYLIATDLNIANNTSWHTAQYEGSKGIFVWESDDLINWNEFRLVNIGVPEAGCVWAPEAIYLPDSDRFFVFYASMVSINEEAPKQRIYGTYTKDFKEFSAPFIYVQKNNHVIDMTMIKDNNKYYRFTKDETTKRVIMDCVTNVEDVNLSETRDIQCQILEETDGVEGPEIYRLPDGRFCLIMDQFASHKGYKPFICTSLEKADFVAVKDNEYSFDLAKKRHGGIIEISDEEYNRMMDFYTK